MASLLWAHLALQVALVAVALLMAWTAWKERS